jgi:hypothetical protein
MPCDEEVIRRAGSLRAMTRLTAQEFQALLPPFEQAFVAYTQDHTIEWQPRTLRSPGGCKSSRAMLARG